MKTSTRFLTVLMAIFLAVGLTHAQQQIPFEGYVADGEGIAGWNADGSGPEPAATGHQVPAPGFGNQYYYGASQDYITGNPDDAAFHFLSGMTGFPQFEQALADHGFTPDQVKCKYGLCSLEEDVEGLDWFFIDDWAYANYYSISFVIELDGEPILSGFMDWANWHINTVGGNLVWEVESGYTSLNNVAENGTGHYAVAQAFLNDLDGKEIKTSFQANFGGQYINGEGRDGAFENVINGMLTVGNPNIPIQGLHADNEGTASWNADGTGPEPYGYGHDNTVYYSASVDYDGINSSPDACLGHFLEGSTGFFNTLLQLQYRGFEISDLKMKMGLCSLGPDVENEDWGVNQNGQDWVNEYNQRFTIEIDGEPIIEYLQDTNKMTFINPGTTTWSTKSSVGKVYDISENASPEAQYVAQSFLRDVGTHYLVTDVADITYVGPMPPGNGRSGVWYELVEGYVKAVHTRATFVEEGPVSGEWTMENSPYNIEGPVSVEQEDSLIIHEGVRVAIRGPFPITVKGYIKAEGNEDSKILFSASNPNITWDGLDYEGANILSSEPSVYNQCIFQYGRAQSGEEYNSGGAIAVRDYNDLEFYNCTFRHNMADLPAVSFATNAGAIGLWNASPIIQKCIFYDNYALHYAGAILAYLGSSPVISNCLFFNNESERGGALAYYENSNGILINNTIADNYATYGGGLYFYMQSNPEIINTILWGNEADAGHQVYSSTNSSSNPGFYYCDIEEGQAGFGGSQINGGYFSNLEEDPLFTDDPESTLYTVDAASPCIDAGTPDTSAWYYPQYLPETCLCGNPRKSGTNIDMGAYEYVILGIEDPQAIDHSLHIYPNPVQGEATIKLKAQNKSVIRVELYNSIGKKVETILDGTVQAGDQTINFQTMHLKTGMYFCRIQAGNKAVTKKIIKL